MILPKYKWPKYLLQFKQLKGIYYGKCKSGWPLRMAHAHCNTKSKDFGWICLNHEVRVRNKRLMLHEVAHLIVGFKYHHGDVWRRALLKIGGTLKEFPITKSFWSADMHRKTRHDYLLHRAQKES
jgi:hypothetical protein